ncbi:MAG: hypothetical protein BWY75_03525 [bacterium ADurb.Bin425]|nr:MAG: hypothetical protein BWY75_03525 [bacterium ADurb.Bin425]
MLRTDLSLLRLLSLLFLQQLLLAGQASILYHPTMQSVQLYLSQDLDQEPGQELEIQLAHRLAHQISYKRETQLGQELQAKVRQRLLSKPPLLSCVLASFPCANRSMPTRSFPKEAFAAQNSLLSFEIPATYPFSQAISLYQDSSCLAYLSFQPCRSCPFQL